MSELDGGDEPYIRGGKAPAAKKPAICQAEGCGIDLSGDKVYYQRHRVCAEHLRELSVVVAGVPSRFCQQCARFHAVEEFDGTKRSCRTRLSQHNARRRRKPDPEEGGGLDGDEGSGTSQPLPVLAGIAGEPAARTSDPGGGSKSSSWQYNTGQLLGLGASGVYGAAPAPNSGDIVSKRPQRAAALASMALIQAEVGGSARSHGVSQSTSPALPDATATINSTAIGAGPSSGGTATPAIPSPLARSSSGGKSKRSATTGPPSRSRMRLDSSGAGDGHGAGGYAVEESGSGNRLPTVGGSGAAGGQPPAWLARAYMSQPGPTSATYYNAPAPHSGPAQGHTGLSGSMATVKLDPGLVDGNTWSGSLHHLGHVQQMVHSPSHLHVQTSAHSEPLHNRSWMALQQGGALSSRPQAVAQHGSGGQQDSSMMAGGNTCNVHTAASGGGQLAMTRLAPLAEMPDWAMTGLHNDLLVLGEGQGEGGDVDMEASNALEAELTQALGRGSSDGTLRALLAGGSSGGGARQGQLQNVQVMHATPLPTFTIGSTNYAELQQVGTFQQVGGSGMTQLSGGSMQQATVLSAQPFTLQPSRPTIVALNSLGAGQAMGQLGMPQGYSTANGFGTTAAGGSGAVHQPLQQLQQQQQQQVSMSAPLSMAYVQWPLTSATQVQQVTALPAGTTHTFGTGPAAGSSTLATADLTNPVPQLQPTTLSSPQLNMPDIDMLTAELGGGWGAPSPASAATTAHAPHMISLPQGVPAAYMVPAAASGPSSGAAGLSSASGTPGAASGVDGGGAGAAMGRGSSSSVGQGAGGGVMADLGSQEMLRRISLKVAGCTPDQLPGDLYSRLANLVATSDTASLHALLNGS